MLPHVHGEQGGLAVDQGGLRIGCLGDLHSTGGNGPGSAIILSLIIGGQTGLWSTSRSCKALTFPGLRRTGSATDPLSRTIVQAGSSRAGCVSQVLGGLHIRKPSRITISVTAQA